MPEWAALELQGELKKWKKDKSAAQQHGDDGDLAKDPADLKLFASSFVAGLKFGLFQIDPKVRASRQLVSAKVELNRIDRVRLLTRWLGRNDGPL